MIPARAARAKPEESAARSCVDLTRMWSIFGFGLRMLDIRMMRAVGERLSALGLTPATATTLLVLETNPGISQGMLADALAIRRPNMTKLINRLEADDLLARRATPDDRRRILLDLTPAGQRLAVAALDVLRAHDMMAMNALDAEERRQLLGLLGRMRESLAPWEGGAAPEGED